MTGSEIVENFVTTQPMNLLPVTSIFSQITQRLLLATGRTLKWRIWQISHRRIKESVRLLKISDKTCTKYLQILSSSIKDRLRLRQEVLNISGLRDNSTKLPPFFPHRTRSVCLLWAKSSSTFNIFRAFSDGFAEILWEICKINLPVVFQQSSRKLQEHPKSNSEHDHLSVFIMSVLYRNFHPHTKISFP